MKSSGKIYNLMNLLSEEEKEERKKCRPGIESVNNFDKLIANKTEKLISDLNDSDSWDVEINENEYLIKNRFSKGSQRNPVSSICRNPLSQYISIFDSELQKFLDKYEG